MSDLINKKMIIILSIIVTVFVILLIVISLLSGAGTVPFPRILDQMERAAVDYYNDNIEELGLESGSSLVLSTTRLEENYLRSLNSMVEDGVNCHGEVRITNIGDVIRFFPYLDCGEAYKTELFYEKILENEEILNEGPGLYQMGDKYVFRGKRINNYLEFADKLWFIVDINQEGYVKIVETNGRNRTRWDNRLNTETERNGVNEFLNFETEHSDMKFFLDGLAMDEEILPKEAWGYLSYMDLCVAPRSREASQVTGSDECQIKSQDHLVGILAAYEFLRVSLEEECVYTTAEACQNFNYLAHSGSRTWLATPVAGNTDRVFYTAPARIVDSRASTRRRINMVVILNPNVSYVSGDGSEEFPYVIE